LAAAWDQLAHERVKFLEVRAMPGTTGSAD
jgi:hypothetical protein